MILKEFEQKLKTFLESGNTGKYKLRIVDKKAGINSFVSIFSVNPTFIGIADRFNIDNADLLNQGHFCIIYDDINDERQSPNYMEKDVLVNLEDIVDIVDKCYNQSDYNSAVYDIPVYIYYTKENNDISDIYTIINLQNIEINNSKKTIDLILGNIIYESIVVQRTCYWNLYEGMTMKWKDNFKKVF